MPDVLDGNPQINAVLLRVRQQLRDAVASGEKGKVLAAVPYFTKRLGTLETSRSVEDNLTSLSGKS